MDAHDPIGDTGTRIDKAVSFSAFGVEQGKDNAVEGIGQLIEHFLIEL
jgi:hypothetical protein